MRDKIKEAIYFASAVTTIITGLVQIIKSFLN